MQMQVVRLLEPVLLQVLAALSRAKLFRLGPQYMDDRKIKRETERVVRKVLNLVESYDAIGKQEFEAVIGKIIGHVHKNTGTGIHVIMQKTDKVLRDLPDEYGRLSEDSKSWEAMIMMLPKNWTPE
jgi:hypothetical protein